MSHEGVYMESRSRLLIFKVIHELVSRACNCNMETRSLRTAVRAFIALGVSHGECLSFLCVRNHALEVNNC